MSILSVNNLCFAYKKDKPILQNICFDVEAGDMVLLCGKSGSGKTTLLNLLKKEIAPRGEFSGEILYEDTPLYSLAPAHSACDIGIVRQNLEGSIVCDTVAGELSFGLSSLGFPADVIKRRIAEMCSFFNISSWYNEKVENLSGGQKQILNLASVLSLYPKLLLLDEPTSQLSPTASALFLDMVYKINRDLGITVIIAEQKTEDVFPICNKVLGLCDGKVKYYDKTHLVVDEISKTCDDDFIGFLPSLAHIFAGDDNIPLTVREGRKLFKEANISPISPKNYIPQKIDNPIIEICDLGFAYNKNRAILKDLWLDVKKGEILTICGDNGSGKSTLLKLLAKILAKSYGKIKLIGRDISKIPDKEYYSKIGYLPQNIRTMFIADTLLDDLLLHADNIGLENRQEVIDNLLTEFSLSHKKHSHPFDLSSGELQRGAIIKILLNAPSILILDEPTKALDSTAKSALAKILTSLKNKGSTIIMSCHDTEFSAEISDRIAILFDGELSKPIPPFAFFGNNYYYTTTAHKIAGAFYPNCVTAKEVADIWQNRNV
ncbi:MAG: ABC transporter ATP-binding protein [Oscillospiraceae bacterium]|nr:ABC transporter ATP-binding protein [Oscillospiraceae bacterium]